MLAACRTQGDLYAVPPFDLATTDVEGFLDELRAFHGVFQACFVRREPREHFFHYMAGQLSALERKTIEPMALHLEGGKVRGLQRFISHNVWKEDKMKLVLRVGSLGHSTLTNRVCFDEACGVAVGTDRNTSIKSNSLPKGCDLKRNSIKKRLYPIMVY